MNTAKARTVVCHMLQQDGKRQPYCKCGVEFLKGCDCLDSQASPVVGACVLNM